MTQDAATLDPATEDETDETLFTVEGGTPRYVQGHFDTSLEKFPWVFEMGPFKTGWIKVGDEADGPIVVIVELGPNLKDEHAHYHNSAQVRFILKGSQRIGTKWYKQGDIRIQQPGRYYGPEETGPEGVTQLLYFTDRRAMYPHYLRPEGDDGHGMFKGLMAASGIDPI